MCLDFDHMIKMNDMKVETHLIICSHLTKLGFFPSKLVFHEVIELQATPGPFAARLQRTRRRHAAACGTSLSSPRSPTAAPLNPLQRPPRCSTPPEKPRNTSDSVSKYTIVFSTTDNNKNNQCHNDMFHNIDMNKLHYMKLTLKGFKPKLDLNGYFISKYPDIVRFSFLQCKKHV